MQSTLLYPRTGRQDCKAINHAMRMKKIIMFFAAVLVSITAFAGPFGSGMTFYNGNATLDLYDDYNKVCYHTNGASYSHVGEWTESGRAPRVVRRGSRPDTEGHRITIRIHLSNRTVEWSGKINYQGNRIVSLTLNGQTWYRQ